LGLAQVDARWIPRSIQEPFGKKKINIELLELVGKLLLYNILLFYLRDSSGFSET